MLRDAINVQVEKFPDIYKKLLSIWNDGKPVLFFAFQVNFIYNKCKYILFQCHTSNIRITNNISEKKPGAYRVNPF